VWIPLLTAFIDAAQAQARDEAEELEAALTELVTALGSQAGQSHAPSLLGPGGVRLLMSEGSSVVVMNAWCGQGMGEGGGERA
ncbi:hypothetical protein T484DRAFT_1864889, partial [Baffinella frigidus]